jgi:hypothetical protein
MRFFHPLERSAIGPRFGLYAGLIAVLGGCAGNQTNSLTEYGTVTLHPGQTATCLSSPCEVYFQMPEGSGSYVVTGNQVKAGEYPGGQKAYLGGYWAGRTIFKVEGLDVPEAYLTVLGR